MNHSEKGSMNPEPQPKPALGGDDAFILAWGRQNAALAIYRWLLCPRLPWSGLLTLVESGMRMPRWSGALGDQKSRSSCLAKVAWVKSMGAPLGGGWQSRGSRDSVTAWP